MPPASCSLFIQPATMTPSILIVDDNCENFDIIEGLLSQSDYEINYASGGAQALEFMAAYAPSLILLDVMMPDIDGIEVCRRIKTNPDWQGIPVIMVTALTAKADLARCMQAGADDFISKPVDGLELKARVQSHLRLYFQQQQIQQLNQTLETQVQERTARIQQLVDYDELTRLPNRRSLLARIEKTLKVSAPETVHARCALIYLDCDQFQLVNHSLGHEIGNQVLVGLADRLRSLTHPDEMLARIGEDEFCLLIPAVAQREIVERRVSTLLLALEEPFLVAGYEVFVSASMGVAFCDRPEQSAIALLQDADTALYTAKKRNKRGHVEVFDNALHDAAMRRLFLETDLRRALKNEEFVLYYQPFYRLNPRQITGFEALIRWQHPDRGLVSPGEFIPSLEQTGLIVPVGKWVLRQACEQLHCWQQISAVPLTMSVNLSVRQFSHPYLLEDIQTIIKETEIDPARLKLEITESALVDNAEAAAKLIRHLRSLKIQISIDDFGTGYSSLSYLNQFPANMLKIDRSFVNDIQHSPEIVCAIVTLGHALDMELIAEGIEEESQAQQLQTLQCEYGQGYWLGRPAPVEQSTPLIPLVD